MATPYAHGYWQQALNQCAVTCNLYIIASCYSAIYAIGTIEAVCILEAIFCYMAGSSVACGRGCVLMATFR
jgi:hypothetical protein